MLQNTAVHFSPVPRWKVKRKRAINALALCNDTSWSITSDNWLKRKRCFQNTSCPSVSHHRETKLKTHTHCSRTTRKRLAVTKGPKHSDSKEHCTQFHLLGNSVIKKGIGPFFFLLHPAHTHPGDMMICYIWTCTLHSLFLLCCLGGKKRKPLERSSS